jgi:hypothetical protein
MGVVSGDGRPGQIRLPAWNSVAANAFSEYFAGLDQITDDDLWSPEVCGADAVAAGGLVPQNFGPQGDFTDLIAAQKHLIRRQSHARHL